MLLFEFYECVYSSDFKNFNQFVLKKSRCHRRQIIYKKQDIYVGFGLVSAAVFTVDISKFSQIGSWEALMGTQWGRNILCVVLDTKAQGTRRGRTGFHVFLSAKLFDSETDQNQAWLINSNSSK